MTQRSLLQTTHIPFGSLTDFDLVTTRTGPLLVGTHPDGACSWDPLRDQWSVHRLDNPWQDGEPGAPVIPTVLGAVMVDGRVVLGGGSEELPFTQWDLATGAVRVHADADDGNVSLEAEFLHTMEFPGRALFLPSTAMEVTAVWDAAYSSTEGHLGEVSVCSDNATTGMLHQQPVLLADDSDGRVVWDLLDHRYFVREFDTKIETTEGTEHLQCHALAHVAGRPQVVGVGYAGTLVLGDAGNGTLCGSRGTWGEPFPNAMPSDDETCSVAVGTVHGLPIAVTCTIRESADPDSYGTLRRWDLEGRRELGAPINTHEGGALGFQLTELAGRPVAVTVGASDETVRVWALDC